MATRPTTCYVFIQLPGSMETVPCASLTVRQLAAAAYEGVFTYGRRYLERSNAISPDPYHLPLTPRPMSFTKLLGIPGAVRDASPDAWGRRVIEAKLGRPAADMSEIEYLLNGPDDGAGNLSFRAALEALPASKPFNRTHHLAALVAAAETLAEDGRLPHEILEQLEPGTSMGGARPKVTVEADERIWLAKLPERKDGHNMQRVEYATLELARAAGLHVCSARLQSIGARDALLLERFDRQRSPGAGGYFRLGLVSGLTVLDAEDGYAGRARWSYPLLADELRRWSARPDVDREELFRRMVFNAMVTNTDDHPRNHALLHTSSGWRLSPAYDIVPVPLISVERRDLALEVGVHGRAASVYNLLSRSAVFGLDTEAAGNLIDTMMLVVKGWREFYAERGVEPRTIDWLEGAILPASFFRQAPPDPV
jgi:serine/threonine-protein kinase HipA